MVLQLRSRDADCRSGCADVRVDDSQAEERQEVGRVGAVGGSAPVGRQDVQSALDGVRQAQQNGNFSDYGQALQRLDDAMKKYNSAK